MMKKPEEIKKGLEGKLGVIFEYDDLYTLHVDAVIRIQNLHLDALAYIQQLEADNIRLTDTIRSLTEQLNAAHDETAKAMRERDAAIADLKSCRNCDVCKHVETICNDCGLCKQECFVCSKFEWRGVCPENTEVQGG